MYQYNDTVTYLLFKFSSTDTSYFLSRLLKCSLIAQSKDEHTEGACDFGDLCKYGYDHQAKGRECSPMAHI